MISEHRFILAGATAAILPPLLLTGACTPPKKDQGQPTVTDETDWTIYTGACPSSWTASFGVDQGRWTSVEFPAAVYDHPQVYSDGERLFATAGTTIVEWTPDGCQFSERKASQEMLFQSIPDQAAMSETHAAVLGVVEVGGTAVAQLQLLDLETADVSYTDLPDDFQIAVGSLTWTGERFLLWGGNAQDSTGSEGYYRFDGYLFSPETLTWEHVPPARATAHFPLPNVRAWGYGRAVLTDQGLFAITTDPAEDVMRGYLLNLETMSWSELNMQAGPGLTNGIGLAVSPAGVYAQAGLVRDDLTRLARGMWFYSFATEAWAPVPVPENTPPDAGAKLLDGRLYFGADCGATRIYDPATNEVTLSYYPFEEVVPRRFDIVGQYLVTSALWEGDFHIYTPVGLEPPPCPTQGLGGSPPR